MEAEQEKGGIIILDLDNNSSETGGNHSGTTMVAPGATLHSYSELSVGDSSPSSPPLSASSSSCFNRERVAAPFVRKTYDIVNNPKTDSIVSWNSDGSRLVVWDVLKFAAEILPAYFRHSNPSSFFCQLNTYVSLIIINTFCFLVLDSYSVWEFICRVSGKRIGTDGSSSTNGFREGRRLGSIKSREELPEVHDGCQSHCRSSSRSINLPDVKGRKLFLLMAQYFLEITKGKIPGEDESPNAIQENKESNDVLAGSDTNSRSESHKRLEKLVEEGEDIMIGIENLLEGPADWEDYVKKLEEKGADLKTRP